MCNDPNRLQFKGGNPGAVQFGNFINYYQFHSPDDRIKLLPENIWNIESTCIALDVGCNAGNLTVALRDFLLNRSSKDSSILGIDIDPLLIDRAKELAADNVTFTCLDIMDESERNEIINNFLLSKEKERFSIVFCFSTSMWIHLNYGDEGLKSFLKYLCSVTDTLVLEAQPWKCYKTAVKRMKQNNFTFPEFGKLKLRENIESDIQTILTNDCNMIKLFESDKNAWDRKLLIFKRKS
ncbi:unnamed protein product [Phyllotreta striolata]|uniref:RNA methyltransferase n=1 Tax=Phyllotreta striolata TaxID=444603 RepID=A0A9N9THP4_PHYSR|nr:unnamed protein product [Phyllotreta striolata]